MSNFKATHVVTQVQTGKFFFPVGHEVMHIGNNYYKDSQGNMKYLDMQYVEEIKNEPI